MAIVSRATLVLVAMATTACQMKLEEPVAPDTRPLEASYENPPGLLGQSNPAMLKAFFEQQRQLLQTTGNFAALTQILDAASENEELVANGDDPQQGVESRLLAVAKATHVCRGPQGDDIIDADRFGTIKMTLKGGLKGIFPVAWGEFDACSDHSPLGPFTIDGPYSFTVRRRAGGRDILFLFQGTITSANVNFNGSLTARVLADFTSEVLVKGAEGNVVLAVDPSGGTVLARDRTGLWTCDPTTFRCVNQTTGEVVPK
jgi:hypothetical protein